MFACKGRHRQECVKNGIVSDKQRDHCITWGRVTRQTKVVSKCKQKIDYSLRIRYGVEDFSQVDFRKVSCFPDFKAIGIPK